MTSIDNWLQFNIGARGPLTEDAQVETSKKLPGSWSNPYRDRKNGGIPCYSEERSLERAAKVSLAYTNNHKPIISM